MRKRTRINFGQVIAKARSESGLQLKDVAALVRRENGQTISHQYLSDIEHNRRPAPSDHIIDQLAKALKVPREYLYLHARRLPSDFDAPEDKNLATAAYRALCDKAALTEA